VRSALSKIDGIEVIEVTKTTAKIKVDRSKVTDKQIIDAVASAGDYSAKIK